MLTKNVILNPLETWQVSCITGYNVHMKRVHMVAESPKHRLDGLQLDVYAVPTYSKLIPSSNYCGCQCSIKNAGPLELPKFV